jgi:hypothetical protein
LMIAVAVVVVILEINCQLSRLERFVVSSRKRWEVALSSSPAPTSCSRLVCVLSSCFVHGYISVLWWFDWSVFRLSVGSLDVATMTC